MRIAVFDVGGTLRRVRLADGSMMERHWEGIKALYHTLLKDPEWKVIIVTAVPKTMTDEDVTNGLERWKIQYPEELYITRDGQMKGEIYAKVKPDLVFEDTDVWLQQALEHGALGLKVV